MATDYKVKGIAPDMTIARFQSTLRAAKSPVSDVEAAAVFAYCVARGFSPAALLAWFNHESGMGRNGWAAITHSWGNSRPPSFAATPTGVYDQDNRQFYRWSDTRPNGPRYLCAYADWVAGGISTVARFFDHAPYVGKNTVAAIVPLWAPSNDGNDTAAYIASVLADIQRFKETSMGNVPQPQTTSRPSPNRNGYAGKRRVDAVVWHVTAGGEAGSLSWLTNPASSASANYLIGKDGTIYELVPPTEDAWANGAVNKPDTTNPLIPKWQAEGVNFNQRTVSIETVRETSANEQPGGFTPAQYQSLVTLTAWLCQEFRLMPDRTHIFGHRTIDSVNRAHCPGLAESEWFALVAAVAALVNGPPPTTPPLVIATQPTAHPEGWMDVGQPDTFLWPDGAGIITYRKVQYYNSDTKATYEREWSAAGGYTAWAQV